MQLPLSASALVMLGVGAVLLGALILVVVGVRRRKPASRPTRIPPDMRMPQQPAATPGPYVAAPAADKAARPHIPAPETAQPAPVEPVAVPAEQAPAPQPLAGSVAAATMPRPMEISSRVDPPGGGEQVPPDRTPPGVPADPSRHHQAGSGRTVAAAVAQAFAVRAAAGRGGVQQPVAPAPPEDGAAAVQDSAVQDSSAAPVESEPAPQAVEPQWRDHGVEAAAMAAAPEVGDVDGHAPAPVVHGVDPAAATDPDGAGLAAMARPGSDDEPPAVEADAPGTAASGDGLAPTAAHGSNGDHRNDANGQSPEGWPVPEPGPAADGQAAAAGAGFLAAGLPVPAPTPEPVTAAVPAPRPDNDGVAQQDGSASDARDRLLAVLLDDPARAVGAAVELETCLRELERLSDAARTGRAALRDVLHRLAAAGLRPEQLARLAGMPLDEVEGLLEAAPAEQKA